MTSQCTARGRAIQRRHLDAAEMAAREMGGLSLEYALSLCELLASLEPAGYERAALRWPQRFIDERVPPLAEVALAASALAEVRYGDRAVGFETLTRLLSAPPDPLPAKPQTSSDRTPTTPEVLVAFPPKRYIRGLSTPAEA